MAVTRYVSEETTPLYVAKAGTKRRATLLWGDRVVVTGTSGTRRAARARGLDGFVDAADLGDERLLELYFIDVGQGDGVLICLPDGRHVLIDGGYRRDYQPTGKSGADFVDWKFARDYEEKAITLDAMVASHCDADHYGGLWDLVEESRRSGLDVDEVKVDRLFHAGVSWWTDGTKRFLGGESGGFLSRILGGTTDVDKSLKSSANPRLQGEWGQFLAAVRKAKIPVERVSQHTEHLPGFEPGAGKAAIRVLGPFDHGTKTKPKLRSLRKNDDDQNTNGQSIVLRLDYGRARILLTGDLNLKAQQMLLQDYAGLRQELQSDVMKGCHHGSDDVSYEFLDAVKAACTIISSGDNEKHAHPRPTIVAASGQTGHTLIDNDQVDTPLVYATEIARSVRLGTPVAVVVTIEDEDGNEKEVRVESDKVHVIYEETRYGDLNPMKGATPLADTKVVPGIIYGLVNVRTDGETILCATRNEKSGGWDLETFTSRF